MADAAVNSTSREWYMGGDPWTLCQTSRQPERSIYFETVLSQANGHMGIRAYTEERSGEESLREGYLAGVFSHLGPKATKLTAPRDYPVSEMVTMPEIFACELTLAGERFDSDSGEVAAFERSLDMQSGVLRRQLTWKSPAGRSTTICFERFLSAARSSLACHRIIITPNDWEGDAVVTWEMDGTIPTLVRFGAKAFPQHPQDHLRVVAKKAENGTGLLHLKTRGTEHDVAIAACVAGYEAATDFPQETHLRQIVNLKLEENKPAEVARCVSVVTSRDRLSHEDAAAEALVVATEAARGGYDACLEDSCQVWRHRWEIADVRIDGPDRDQKIIRFNLFQLLQTASWDSDRMSLAPRALSFNRYLGLYFWDTETFILPFYSAVFPDVAKNLLAFRYHTLDGARETAAANQAKGALYPWQADADRGEDHSLGLQTPKLRHPTADIAYAVDQYAQISGDIDFMAEMGMEILAETARYWQSKIVIDETGVGHMDGAVGPDEGRTIGRDNGYTNLMARHNLKVAAAWYERLGTERPEAVGLLNDKIKLDETEASAWLEAANTLNIPVVPETDIPLQDEFLLGKEPAPPEVMAFRDNPSAGEIPATRVNYRVIKQADIVLAALLLQDEFTPDQIARMYDFYEPMTLHISSLSRNTHAIVAALMGRTDVAYDWFLDSASMDIEDFDHCTEDGLHAAALGGCWQGLVIGFGGLRVDDDGCHFRPNLPSQWKSMEFTISDHGEYRQVKLTGQ